MVAVFKSDNQAPARTFTNWIDIVVLAAVRYDEVAELSDHRLVLSNLPCRVAAHLQPELVEVQAKVRVIEHSGKN